jgi:hypothetical protein
MTAFGKCDGGGRRTAPREALPLLATLTTVSRTYSGTLIDISATGARIRGEALPAAEQDLMLTVEKLRSFATVRWNHDGEIGLQFDPPLSPTVVMALRHEVAKGRGFTPEERAAYDAWKLGVAR